MKVARRELGIGFHVVIDGSRESVQALRKSGLPIGSRSQLFKGLMACVHGGPNGGTLAECKTVMVQFEPVFRQIDPDNYMVTREATEDDVRQAVRKIPGVMHPKPDFTKLENCKAYLIWQAAHALAEAQRTTGTSVD